jgi:Methylated DNA-protein cysteine methyltransferase
MKITDRKGPAWTPPISAFDSPWGPIYGYFSALGLQALCLPDPRRPLAPYMLHSRHNRSGESASKPCSPTTSPGVIVDFREVPLDWAGGTPFQRAVWTAARDLPWGQTVSYGELARRIGTPGAAGRRRRPRGQPHRRRRALPPRARRERRPRRLQLRPRLETAAADPEGVPFKE